METATPDRRSPARSGRNTKELKAMADCLGSFYGLTLTPRTLEKRIVTAKLAPKIRMPLDWPTVLTHRAVEQFSRSGEDGTVGVVAILYALGLTEHFPEVYSDETIRTDLHAVVESIMVNRVTGNLPPDTDEWQDRIWNEVNNRKDHSRLINLEVRRRLSGQGKSRDDIEHTIEQLQSDVVQYLDSDGDGFARLAFDFEELFNPADETWGLSQDEKRRLNRVGSDKDLVHDAIDYTPLVVLREKFISPQFISDDPAAFALYNLDVKRRGSKPAIIDRIVSGVISAAMYSDGVRAIDSTTKESA